MNDLRTQLLAKHKAHDRGIWRITAEDTNCDMAGSHHEADLALVKGRYDAAVDYALKLRGFVGWGAGGSIIKQELIILGASKKKQAR